MKAIILAAGRGGRLRGVIGERPKCLARVGDRTLLDRQIEALSDAGIDDITVVAGYGYEEVSRACPDGVVLARNSDFATTNSLYSLWLVRDQLTEGFLVMNCDVLFHPRMLADLLGARAEDALLVDPRVDRPPFGDEEMKVGIRRGLVAAIAKTLDEDATDAENVGIGRFGRDGAALLVRQMDALLSTGARREWLPRAFGAFAALRPLRAVDTRGLPWIEIDFPEDYWRACGEVLPAIEAAVRAEASVTAAPTAASATRDARTMRHV